MSENQAQWLIPVIPALTQEAKADSHEVKDSLGYIPRLIPYELVLQDWRERESFAFKRPFCSARDTFSNVWSQSDLRKGTCKWHLGAKGQEHSLFNHRQSRTIYRGAVCALIRLLSVLVALRRRSLVLIASKFMLIRIQATMLVRFCVYSSDRGIFGSCS